VGFATLRFEQRDGLDSTSGWKARAPARLIVPTPVADENPEVTGAAIVRSASAPAAGSEPP
jgi:hypothetical protein